MGEAMKLPALKLPKLAMPRLKRWDLYALGLLLLGMVVTAVNVYKGITKPAGEPYPSWLTVLVVFTQLGVACGGLMVLGKTAKEGTGWGNAFSLLATFIGVGGVLIAAALWAAA
jgi:hypothetical protein